jgi:hypothetical protein
MSTFPDDADGDALRRIASDADMSKPMAIDFAVAVPNERVGREIATLASGRGYTCTVVQNDSGDWDCICTRSMLATYDGVIAAQEELEQLARPHGGCIDGWGTFGNSDAV